MKLWSFIFAQPGAPLQAAYVAAPHRGAACAYMQEALGTAFDPHQRRPAEGVILQFAGALAADRFGVITAIARDGRALVPDDKGGWHEAR